MSKVVVGSIPEKICYTFSDEIEVPVGCDWDIDDDWDDEDEDEVEEKNVSSTLKEKVLPTFPADNNDEKTKVRAKKWAEAPSYHSVKRKDAKTKVVDNSAIKNVRLLSLEYRGNGGRAYKALIDKFYVDIREDVVMDTILKAGIKEGGILQGEYVWAKTGAQMKLIRVGSELHKIIVEFDSKRNAKPVSKKDLEVGGVYQDRKKNKVIFVGYVDTCTLTPEERSPPYYQRENKKASFNLKHNKIKKSMLFYELYDSKKRSDYTQDMKSEDGSYYYMIKKTHNYIEKVDQIKIPENIIEYLRGEAVKKAKDFILEYTGHKVLDPNVSRIDSWALQETICYNSNFINLYPTGGQAVEPFDIKKLVLFS